MNKLLMLILVSRPTGWFILSSVFFAGAWFSGGIDKHPSIAILIALSLSFPICLNGYGLNDVYDVESDRRNPRKRVYIKSPNDRIFIKKSSHLAGLFVLAVSAISLNPTLMVLMSLLVLSSYGYSVPPLRLREHPPYDSVLNSIGYFLLPAAAGWSLAKPILQLPGDVYILTVALIGIHAFSSIADYSADKAAKHNTFAVTYGRRITAIFATSMIGFSFAFLPIWYTGLCGLISALVIFHPNEKFAKVVLWLFYFGFIAAIIQYYIYLWSFTGNPFVRGAV